MKSVLKSFLTVIVLLCAHLKIIAQSHVGNVGIGVTQPLTKLHVEDTITQTSGKTSLYVNTTSLNETNAIYRGINARISGLNGDVRAIQGYSYGENNNQNIGVVGFANFGKLNYGIIGSSTAENNDSIESNFGVTGYGSGARLLNVGIRGYSISTNPNSVGSNYGSRCESGNAKFSVGVYGQSTIDNYIPESSNIGLVGRARNSIFKNIGVSAEASYTRVDSDTTSNYAVLANAFSSYGGTNYGVYTRSYGDGTNYGIYSEAFGAASTNYAGFFNGDVTITGTLSNPSDVNLKTNIKPLSKATDILNRLRPVEYEYKKSIEGKSLILPKNHQYGFIAQELQTVLPDLVAQQKINLASTGGGLSEDGLPSNKDVQKSETQEFLGINYMSLIPILVQGLKEQDERIKMLEKKILEMSKQ